MESSIGLMEATARPDPGAIRITQIGLLLAAVGAMLVVFGLIGMVGLVMTVVGAVLAARAGIGHAWYTVVAAGAVSLGAIGSEKLRPNPVALTSIGRYWFPWVSITFMSRGGV